MRFFRFWRSRKKQSGEINPDEILIDARNLPQFETERFEGRMERPISRFAVFFVAAVSVMVFTVFIVRIYDLEITKGKSYEELSRSNRLREYTAFANRGAIFDRNQELLAWNDVQKNGEDFAQRAYVSLPGLAHVIGYARPPKRDTSGRYYSLSYVGGSGAEKFFDSFLTGTNGQKLVETDVYGEVQSESVFIPPEDGRSVVLSIDSKLTNKLYQSIYDLGERVGFHGGAGVIMDIKTGEVVALTSYPEFSPSIMAIATNTSAIKKYNSDQRSPFLNRAVDGLYTPGSIVKPYVALAALKDKIISPEKEILSTGSLSIPNPYNPNLPSVFRDWKAHGWVNMTDALAVSSNVYFFTVGGGFEDQKGIGIDKVSEGLKLFGFGSEVPGDFFSGVEGVVPNPEWKKEVFPDEPWRLGDTYNTSIGQYGFQVTPLQAIRAVAALGNGGILLTPTIVARGNDLRQGTSTVINIPKKDLEIINNGMREGVLRGTAAALNISGVNVAAKTGTAELGTKKEEVNSWVTGYFPYENPRYAFVVLMERGPRSNLYGAVVAMREVMEWIRDEAPEYLKESD